jgi:hypothetical protein
MYFQSPEHTLISFCDLNEWKVESSVARNALTHGRLVTTMVAHRAPPNDRPDMIVQV